MLCEQTFIKEIMSKWLKEIKIIVFIIYVVFIKELGFIFAFFLRQ